MADETFHPSPRRWLLLAGVSLSIFLEVGVLKCYGVFLDDITRDLQTSTGLVGLITGMAQGLPYILGRSIDIIMLMLTRGVIEGQVHSKMKFISIDKIKKSKQNSENVMKIGSRITNL